VGSILEYYIYHLRYLFSLILDAIHVIHWYWSGELASVETVLLYKALINENPYTSRVNQCIHRKGLRYISGFKGDREV